MRFIGCSGRIFCHLRSIEMQTIDIANISLRCIVNRRELFTPPRQSNTEPIWLAE
jgi:hypothetical protein